MDFPRKPAGDRLRVGMLCPDLNQAGAEVHQLTLIGLTIDKVDWVGLAFMSPASEADPAMLEATAKLLPVRFGKGAVADLAAACDVIVSWVVDDLEVGGTPTIFVDHFPHEGPYPPLTRHCLRDVSRIVAVSEVALPGVPPEWADRSLVVWNAVDPARLAPSRPREAMRAAWGVPATAKVAGFYARRSLEKRPDAMVRLVSSLPPDWHVVLIGESRPYPDEEEYLRGEAASLPPEIAGRFHLLPPDPAAGDVLDAVDVLVDPAEMDSFGLTKAEALWMGVPVVGTPVGIARLHPELVYPIELDAEGGALAAATIRAFEQGPRPGSKEFARTRFSPERFAREWLAVFEAAAGRPLPLPSLARQAVSLLSSVAKHIGAGGGSAPPDSQAERLAICRRCPFYVAEGDRCSRCGCGMSAKASLPTSSCPEGKWGPELRVEQA